MNVSRVSPVFPCWFDRRWARSFCPSPVWQNVFNNQPIRRICNISAKIPDLSHWGSSCFSCQVNGDNLCWRCGTTGRGTCGRWRTILGTHGLEIILKPLTSNIFSKRCFTQIIAKCVCNLFCCLYCCCGVLYSWYSSWDHQCDQCPAGYTGQCCDLKLGPNPTMFLWCCSAPISENVVCWWS